MLPLDPSRAFRILTSRLAWPTALVALIAASAFAVNASAAPLDAEESEPAVAASAEAPPADDFNPGGFDQALVAATHDAEAQAQWVAAAKAAEAAAAEEAARQAAAEAAERTAAAARYQGRGGPSEGQWAALRNCESSGNYGAVSSSGAYRGAYQFSQATWNSVASRHHPHLVGVDPAAAAPADQDAQARALYAMSGRGQWPHCGANLR